MDVIQSGHGGTSDPLVTTTAYALARALRRRWNCRALSAFGPKLSASARPGSGECHHRSRVHRRHEVLSDFAKHIAVFGIERAHGETLRIGFCLFARETQFLGRPHPEQL